MFLFWIFSPKKINLSCLLCHVLNKWTTFTKRLSVANIEELMTTDHFQYVIIQAFDCYFSFDLLDEIERACIFALIQTKATDAINGWIVFKILPQWVGGYSDWLLYENNLLMFLHLTTMSVGRFLILLPILEVLTVMMSKVAIRLTVGNHSNQLS